MHSADPFREQRILEATVSWIRYARAVDDKSKVAGAEDAIGLILSALSTVDLPQVR